MIQDNKKILTVKDIMKEYNLKRDAVYELLNRKGCPLIAGGRREKNKKYRVLEKNFVEWLNNLHKQHNR